MVLRVRGAGVERGGVCAVPSEAARPDEGGGVMAEPVEVQVRLDVDQAVEAVRAMSEMVRKDVDETVRVMRDAADSLTAAARLMGEAARKIGEAVATIGQGDGA